MLKTIKTTKQMRLDELIKYCIENEIEDRTFSIGESTLTTEGFAVVSNPGRKSFRVSGSGNFKMYGYINKNDLFPVEVEEPITEDMIFDYLLTVESDGAVYNEYKKSLGFIFGKTSNVVQILASVNGKYRTIWEREDE